MLGISGWRLDVADEVPDEFLDELRTTVKTILKALIVEKYGRDATAKVAYDRRESISLENNWIIVMSIMEKCNYRVYENKDASALKYALEEIIDHYQNRL